MISMTRFVRLFVLTCLVVGSAALGAVLTAFQLP